MKTSEKALELCHAIEKLPASEQQTAVSIAASNLRRELYDFETQSCADLAGKLYEKYCEAVGGKAFNGDLLPKWPEFLGDNNKVKQSNAWLIVADFVKGL